MAGGNRHMRMLYAYAQKPFSSPSHRPSADFWFFRDTSHSAAYLGRDSAVSSKVAKTAAFGATCKATATLLSFHRYHAMEGLQAAFEKVACIATSRLLPSVRLTPHMASRFAYIRQDKVTDAKLPIDRSRFLSSGHEWLPVG